MSDQWKGRGRWSGVSPPLSAYHRSTTLEMKQTHPGAQGWLHLAAASAIALIRSACIAASNTPTAALQVTPVATFTATALAASRQLTEMTISTGAEVLSSTVTPTPAEAQHSNQIKVALRMVVAGLGRPVDVTHAGDASNRLFIVEKGGTIRPFFNRLVRWRPSPESRLFTAIDSSQKLC